MSEEIGVDLSVTEEHKKEKEEQAANIEAFQRELEGLINRHSIENICDIPDYMLAEHITSYVVILAETIRERDAWFGFRPFERMKETPDVLEPPADWHPELTIES